jgi:hypothetical protein
MTTKEYYMSKLKSSIEKAKDTQDFSGLDRAIEEIAEFGVFVDISSEYTEDEVREIVKAVDSGVEVEGYLYFASLQKMREV